MTTSYRICTRCIMDTTVPDIAFDDAGVCNYCKGFDATAAANPTGEEGRRLLDAAVATMKERGRGHRYDAVLGVSGGTDSTFLLKWAKDVGLRPLAVHCDNGWNSEIAVRNIRRATTKLGIDLYTHVLDWQEFRDLQLAFLRAGTPDADIPTDIALRSVLYRAAAREGIGTILVGVNFRTEGKVPIEWSYADGRYIESVHERHGTVPLRRYPNFKIRHYAWYGFVRRIKQIRPLWWMDYRKNEVKSDLAATLGWEDYGGHHYENIYTRFFQGWYLVQRFGYDKRRVEFSALIRSGQLTRDAALERIREVQYPPERVESDIEYVVKKLGITRAELERIMAEPNRSFHDYDTYYPILKRHARLLERTFRIIYGSPPQIFRYVGDAG